MKNLEDDLQDSFHEVAKHISPSFSFEEVWNKHETELKLVKRRSIAPKWVTGSIVSLTGVVAVVLIIIAIPFGRTGMSPTGGWHNKISTVSNRIDTALPNAEKNFRRKHENIELATAYSPSTKLVSVRMVVFGKISKAEAESLLNQLLTDISKSYPVNGMSPSKLLQIYDLHFEIADAKDKIDPLFYGDKNGSSTQIQWNATPTHRPVLNAYEPVIPGSIVQMTGWVPKGIRGISIQTIGSSQTCSVQDNGYFSCKVAVPNNLTDGLTPIKVLTNNQVILEKTVSVANAYDPMYRIKAEHAIISQYNVNIKQIKITHVKTLQMNQWFLMFEIQKNGTWTPSNGTFGIVVTKESNGQYKIQFPNYG